MKPYIPSLLGIFAGGIEGPWLTWALFNLALAFSRRPSSSTISSSIACDCEESTVSLLIEEACSRELYNLLSSVVPRIKVHQVTQSKYPKLGSTGCGSNDSLGFYPFRKWLDQNRHVSSRFQRPGMPHRFPQEAILIRGDP